MMLYDYTTIIRDAICSNIEMYYKTSKGERK